jgi:hypothetical protein
MILTATEWALGVQTRNSTQEALIKDAPSSNRHGKAFKFLKRLSSLSVILRSESLAGYD